MSVTTRKGATENESVLQHYHCSTNSLTGSVIETDIDPKAKVIPSQARGEGTKMAREISLKRLRRENVRAVHSQSNSGTPRDSLKSSASGDEFPDFFKEPHWMPSLSADPQDSRRQSRHRRNTSSSVIAEYT